MVKLRTDAEKLEEYNLQKCNLKVLEFTLRYYIKSTINMNLKEFRESINNEIIRLLRSNLGKRVERDTQNRGLQVNRFVAYFIM